MGRKAKHHFIPKCYLKGFTDGGENSSPFWAVPINNDDPFPLLIQTMHVLSATITQ